MFVSQVNLSSFYERTFILKKKKNLWLNVLLIVNIL